MRNIGIAIIDDESLVRLGIKSSVAWEEYGYEIVRRSGQRADRPEDDQGKTPGYRPARRLYAGDERDRSSEIPAKAEDSVQGYYLELPR